MRTQRVLWLAIRILGIPLVPLQVVSHAVLGLLTVVTFGVLMFALGLIYLVAFLGPLLGLSWLWLHLPPLRLPAALVGVPWALMGNAFVALVPVVPDEVDSGTTKLLLTALWPYSLRYFQWDMSRLPVGDEGARDLVEQHVLKRGIQQGALQREYIERKLALRRAAAATASPTEEPGADEGGVYYRPSKGLTELLDTMQARSNVDPETPPKSDDGSPARVIDTPAGIVYVDSVTGEIVGTSPRKEA